MDWKVLDKEGFMRRKYSNETMRNLHSYIDKNKLKDSIEGYNEVLDRLPKESFLVKTIERTAKELEQDREDYPVLLRLI